ncbi:hypothetical protein V5O48_015667 [Marasmius crinis-equi]|uniref:Uncharacterized protein n=1 Tax=Marasmius crinis-equi TaxID=585013 RepID=A0ABR3ETW2_9AGAR
MSTSTSKKRARSPAPADKGGKRRIIRGGPHARDADETQETGDTKMDVDDGESLEWVLKLRHLIDFMFSIRLPSPGGISISGKGKRNPRNMMDISYDFLGKMNQIAQEACSGSLGRSLKDSQRNRLDRSLGAACVGSEVTLPEYLQQKITKAVSENCHEGELHTKFSKHFQMTIDFRKSALYGNGKAEDGRCC